MPRSLCLCASKTSSGSVTRHFCGESKRTRHCSTANFRYRAGCRRKFPMSCRPCWWKTPFPGTWSMSARANRISRSTLLFTAASESDLTALTAAARRVFDREYSRSVLHALVEKQLLPVYYARGHLKAAFGEPQPKVVKQPSTANDEGPRNLTTVDVIFPVT